MVYSVSIVNDVLVTERIGVDLVDIGSFVNTLRKRIDQHPAAGFSVNFGGIAHFAYAPFCGCIAWGSDNEICAASALAFVSFGEAATKFCGYI